MTPRGNTGLGPRAIAPAVGRGLRRSFATLVLYGLLFYLVSALVLTPLRAALARAFVETTGQPAISNTQIAAFLATLPGMAWLLVFTITGLALLLAQQAGFVLIARAAADGRDLGPVRTLRTVLACLPRLLAMALVQTLIVLACVLPVLGLAGLVHWLLLSGHDINFYLAERPPRFLLAAGIGAVLAAALAAVLALLVVRWSLALPICLLERRTWMAPLTASWRSTGGSGRAIALLLLGWLAGTTLATGLVASAFVASSEWLLAAVPQRTSVIVLVSAGLFGAVDLLVGLVVLVAGAVYGFLVLQLYLRLRAAPAGVPADPLPAEAPGSAPIRRRRALVGLALAVFAVTSVGSAAALVETLDLGDEVEITAHRGSSEKAPENSLSAIRQAIADGADYAEIDVQETADGTVVLLHDTDLKRVAGLAKGIWEVDYDEVRRLDAGSWFSPAFAGEPIPTLQQAIDLARGRIKLNIELKFNGHDRKLVERVVELIKANRFEDQCVVTSLDQAALARAKALDPDLRTGAIVSVRVGDITRLRVDLLSLIANLATADMVAAAKRQGLAVHVWTVNDRQAMHRMIDRGVDNIITDRPAELAALLRERAALSDVERLALQFGHWLREL